MVEARKDVPDAFVDLVVQIIDGFDLSVGLFLELQPLFWQRQLLGRGVLFIGKVHGLRQ